MASRSVDPLRARWRLLAVALVAVGASACGHAPADEAIASEPVPTIAAEVATVTRRDLTERLLVRGAVVALPNQDVKVAALVAGRVERVSVAEGDTVRAGQVVAVVDPRPLEDQKRQAAATLAQARAALDNATSNLGRTERLLARGIAAGKELEDARAQQATSAAAVEQAEAGLATAERQLARTQVASPIAGAVVKRLVSVGEQVDGTAAQPIVEIANVDRVEVAASVPAGHLGAVRAGQAAIVTSESAAGRTFTGQVVAIAPAVDPATNAAIARVRLANPDHALRVGAYAEVHLALREKRAALTVPAGALQRGEAGTFVYVVSGEQATRTAVQVGIETPDGIELLSGVEEGQQVLASAVHGLGERARLARQP